MKFGDPIIYVENGKEISAIVLRSRVLDDHMGSDNEPLVDLGFFQQVTAPGPDGKPQVRELTGTDWATDLVQFRIDVPHESHEFSEKAKAKYMHRYGGTDIPQEDGTFKAHCVYPGGRWKELTPSAPDVEEVEDDKYPGTVQ